MDGRLAPAKPAKYVGYWSRFQRFADKRPAAKYYLIVGLLVVSIVIIIWAYRRSDRSFDLIEDKEGLEAISVD